MVGWIKDLHDIFVSYLPRKISLDVYMESVYGEYILHIRNITGRDIYISNILINDLQINDFSPQYGEGGERYVTRFLLRNNQLRTIILYKMGVKERPRVISFIVSRKILKPKRIDFHV